MTSQVEVRVRLLGTGNAFSSDARLQACSVVEWGTERLLVDAGPAVLTALERAEIPVESIGSVWLTHLHGDHVAGMPFLRLKAKYLSAHPVEELKVFGPVGTAAHLERLWDAAYPDVDDPPRYVVTELPRERQTITVGDLTVDAVPMVHLPHSIGYRFHVAGKGVAFSGDTDFQRCVFELCEDMDVAVVECSFVANEKYAHVGLDELRENRGELGCKLLVLNHIHQEVVDAARADPVPDSHISHDGDVIVV